MGNLFNDSPKSGKGIGRVGITPTVWNGRLNHEERYTSTTADAPRPSAYTGLVKSGLGEIAKLTGIYAGNNPLVSITPGMDKVTNLLIPAGSTEIRVTFQSNLIGIGLAGPSGDILGEQNLICKLKRASDASWVYLTNSGIYTTTPAQLSHDFMIASVHPISADPGATDFYLVDLTFTVPENAMAEDRHWQLSFGTGSAPGGFTIGGIQSGAAPTISLSPATLVWAPGDMSTKYIDVTSNDDWTGEITQI